MGRRFRPPTRLPSSSSPLLALRAGTGAPLLSHKPCNHGRNGFSVSQLQGSPMSALEDQILAAVGRKNYTPLKPKALARKLGVPSPQYADFRRALRALIKDGRVEFGKNHLV